MKLRSVASSGKNRMRLVFIALILPQLLGAQYVGISLGRSVSTVDWHVDPPPPSCDACIIGAFPGGSRSALTPAAALQLWPTSFVGLATEVRYIQKGYAVTEPRLNVDYLEVPLLMRLGPLVWSASRIAPFLEAGPALGLRARCGIRYDVRSDGCKSHAIADEDWSTRRYDVSLIGAAGVALRIAGGALVIGARTDRGLMDIGHGIGYPTRNRTTLTYASWLWKR
jgi:hypothetical protein